MKQPVVEATVGVPPITVAGMTWFGYAVDDWLKVVSLLWLVIQIGVFIYRTWKSRAAE